VTDFVGRETELTLVQQRLADPTCRLLTITGMGGVGKSRLALRIAHLLADRLTTTQAPQFPDGIYYVPLAALEPHPQLEHLLATTVAATLGISLAGATTPTTQLLQALAEKDLLLILDNCEHLPVAAFINQLLQQAQAIKLLVTSRARLNVRGEQLIRLAGLTTPTATLPIQVTNDDLWRLNDHSAVRLFVQSVQAILPDFTLDTTTAAPVVQICQLLHGLPLGIELAATWAQILPLPEIVQEIRQNLDFLESTQLDAPAHQRSLRAVFNHSWQRLTPAEQQALRRLTVFTGGFTREAAAQVAGATLPLLAQLTDKSLMQRIDPGGEPLTNGAAGARVRYELQPVVRQYAAEALAQAGETATYQARHAAAMAQFLATQRTELEAAKQQEALRAIHAEIENVRAAWQWLLAHLQTAQSGLAQIAEQVSQGLDSLFHFYDMRSWFQEGETIFGQLAQGLSTVIPPLSTPVAAHDWAVALWRLQAKAQARQGWFAFHLGRYDESRRLLTTSLHRLQQIAAEADTIFTLNYLGAVLRHLGEFVPASRYLQAAQRLAEQHNDPRGASIALNVLGQIALVQGDLTEARRLCQQALAIKRAIGDRWGMIFSLGYLGRAAQAAGEYGAAQTLFAECLTIARALDDQRGAAFALQCLGDTAYAAGALAEAQAHYQESLAIYQAIGNRAESSVTLALLGKTYRASGEATQARQALREALALAWSLPSTPGLLAALLGLANLALDAGQEAAALPPLQFVAQHPASSQQQRQQATQLLATLGAAVTVDSDWDLSTYVQTILSDVQTLTPIAPAAQPVAASLHATATATASAMGLIARSQELARLDAALTQMLAGRGQVYFVTGEAGSGKTALTHAFVQRAQATQPALVVADSLCSAQTGVSDPYLPFRQLLHQLTALTDESGVPTGQPPAAGAGDRADHAFLPLVVRSLVEFGPDLIENFVAGGALLARLQRFNGHVGDWGERLRTQIAQLQARGSAPLAQNRIFDQYTAVLQAVAAHRPLLLILDDLHWADASSLSFLFHLARNLAQSRVMLLGAYRPEDLVEDETGKPHPLQSVLGELKRTFGDVTIDLEQAMSRTGRSLVDGLLDSEPNQLGDDFRRALLAHTEGHPLFTVELLRDLKERGALQRDTADQWVAAPTLDWRTLPARVEGVIETRMGRLPRPLLELLQTASIEGEVFTAEVVARLLGSNEQQVVRLLGNDLARRHRLVSAADIITVGTQRLARYRFRHNLFQHYLYHSQTASERLYLHGEVAKALEALYLAGEPTAPAHATAPDAASVDAAALARHYQAAGMVEKALFYLRLAGNRAQQLSAHQEVITHLQQALTLLAPLPAARQRDEQELEMQIALGTVLVAVEGFGAATVEAVYQRALALCHHLGASPHLWPVLHGLWNVHEVRAELPQARTYGDELLRLTAANPEAELGLVAHRDMGATLHHLGEIADSRHYLERGLPFLAATQAQAVALRYSAGPGVGILVYLAADLWLLGYADQAVQRSQAALALAHAMKHPFSLALALNFAGGLHHFRRDPVQVQAVMTQMQMLLAEHAFPVWAAATQGFSGWVLVQQGALAQGIAQMEQGLVAWRAAGQQLSQTFYLGLIAEGYLAAGESEAGLARLDQALALVATLGERYWEAELYRLQGELWRLQPTAAAQAEACFEQAITVARRQEARTLELRATTSLCRLWQQQGKTQAAQERLAAIYGWFTEGFATVDLQETQQLLAALRV
jgi:predicted ATPase/RecA/RadA recombinase